MAVENLTEAQREHYEAQARELLQARRTLEAANGRLRALQELGSALAAALTPADVARLGVEHVLAAGCGQAAWVALIDDSGAELRLLHAVGYPPEATDRFAVVPLEAPLPLAEVTRTGKALWYRTAAEVFAAFPLFAEVHPDVGAVALLPLSSGQDDLGAFGAFGLCFAEPQELGSEDRGFLLALVRMCSQALVRSGLYERERRAAETLQRRLLPSALPVIPGLAAAARYLPGAAGLAVGGDWYDVFALPEGRVGIVMGDIVGRGLAAAAAMGQLRSVLRASALDGTGPARVLDRVSALVETFEETDLATAVYGVFEPGTGVLRYASAGHPPPLVIWPDGTTGYLEGGRSTPLGMPVPSREEASVEVQPGCTILLYTDGLIERRDSSLDEGMAVLA
ncbi:MAG: PP2C family protein-serine/threonine phosphatase, partial [Acidimicrobiia bacterium]